MSRRGSTWWLPVLSVLAALAVLTGCTQGPVVGAAQPTEPPPSPLTAPSSGSSPSGAAGPGPGASGVAPPAAADPARPGGVPSGAAGSPAAAPAAVPSRYVFPVRSAAVQFGRSHHDYPAADIFAPCGSVAVAVTDGVVAEVSRKDTWTARKDKGATRGGLSVSIVGTDGVRYYGSHLSSVAAAMLPGHRVTAGEELGRVGRSGSARPTSCHLHFGISPPCATADWWNRRGVLSPYPFLVSWQKGGRGSPAQAVADWRSEHGCPKQAPKSVLP